MRGPHIARYGKRLLPAKRMNTNEIGFRTSSGQNRIWYVVPPVKEEEVSKARNDGKLSCTVFCLDDLLTLSGCVGCTLADWIYGVA